MFTLPPIVVVTQLNVQTPLNLAVLSPGATQTITGIQTNWTAVSIRGRSH